MKSIDQLTDVEVNQECAKILFGNNMYAEETLPYHILKRLKEWKVTIYLSPHESLRHRFLIVANSLGHWKPTPPEPKWDLWDRDTCPVGEVLVYKPTNYKHLILSNHLNYAQLGGIDDGVYYETLYHNYKRLDGSPCGTRVEDK